MILFLASLGGWLSTATNKFVVHQGNVWAELSVHREADGFLLLTFTQDRLEYRCPGDRHLTGQFLRISQPRRVGPYALVPGAAYVLLRECPVHPDTWDARYVGDWLAA